jgi:hypothetical protein
VDIDLTALPSDIDILHQLVRDLVAQAADDRSELAQAQAEIERLKLIIRRFQRAQFGRRSERIDGDQLALGLEDLGADIARLQARQPATASAQDGGSQPTPHRQGLPQHLPREDVAISLWSQPRLHSCRAPLIYKFEVVAPTWSSASAKYRTCRSWITELGHSVSWVNDF